MKISDLPADKKIILFDGVCNLCNTSLQFVIKHDRKDVFRFVALQSDLGIKIIKHIGVAQLNIDSVVLYEQGFAYYYKSEAVLQIAKNLGGFFYMGTVFRYLPIGFRNFLYDYVAKNRYKWYGKQDNCMMPSQEIVSKFLE